MTDKFEMMAKTFQGLEGVLEDELKALGAEDIEIGKRIVMFKGDKELLYRANYCCYTALRILKPICKFEAQDADELYETMRKFEWDKVMRLGQTLAIDSTVNSDNFNHSKFVVYRAKDAIVDYFSEKYSKRPSIRIQGADINIDVHIVGTQVTVSLDSSGEPLYKRGYRVAQTDAPINEVLAAGLLKLAGWKGESDLLDPMCGSGTFLVEAALIATNTPPGIFRNKFSFENWNDFEPEIFDNIVSDDSAERSFEHTIYGRDISPRAIEIAQANVNSAHVMRSVKLEVKPVRQTVDVPAGTLIISNPPYGERLELDNIITFYRDLGTIFKRQCKGCNVWLIGPKVEAFDSIGLKPSLRYPILNGSIECEFREYVMFDGSYGDFRKEGNSVKNEEFKRNNGVSERFSKGGDSKFSNSDSYVKREDGESSDRPRRRGFGDKSHRNFRDGDERPRRNFRDGDERPRRNFRDVDERPRRNFRDGDERPRRNFRDGDERPRRNFYDQFERREDGKIHDVRHTDAFIKFRKPELDAPQGGEGTRKVLRERKKSSDTSSED